MDLYRTKLRASAWAYRAVIGRAVPFTQTVEASRSMRSDTRRAKRQGVADRALKGWCRDGGVLSLA